MSAMGDVWIFSGIAHFCRKISNPLPPHKGDFQVFSLSVIGVENLTWFLEVRNISYYHKDCPNSPEIVYPHRRDITTMASY